MKCKSAGPVLEKVVDTIRTVEMAFLSGSPERIRRHMMDVMTSIVGGCILYLKSDDQHTYTVSSIDFTATAYVMTVLCLHSTVMYQEITIHERDFVLYGVIPRGYGQQRPCLDRAFSAKVRALSPWAMLEFELLSDTWLQDAREGKLPLPPTEPSPALHLPMLPPHVSLRDFSVDTFRPSLNFSLDSPASPLDLTLHPSGHPDTLSFFQFDGFPSVDNMEVSTPLN